VSKLRTLSTVNDIIDQLGGNYVFVNALKVSSQAVSNWRAKNHLPANTYLFIQAELAKRSLTAPAKLWGMIAVSKPRDLASIVRKLPARTVYGRPD
jgi:hypothetical protein